MANDFTQDVVAALWFESDEVTTDSVGTNTLTANNVTVPSVDTSLFKAGTGSSLWDRNAIPIPGLQISDANLDTGFPLKSGDTDKNFSVCYWIRPTLFPFINTFVFHFSKSSSIRIGAKRTAGVNNFALGVWPEGGGSVVNYIHDSEIQLDQWYHVAVTYSTSAFRIRIWDDTAGEILGTDKTGVPVEINISSSTMRVGFSGASQLTIDGNLDEMVVFKRALTETEIDNVRLGLFGPQPFYPSLATFPAERPAAYDPDFFWQPGEWTDPSTYVPGEWGTGYVATGGGRWGQNLVVAGNNKVYYEAHSGV